MASNLERGIVYDIHAKDGDKIGRGILMYVSYCNNEARAPENCFFMSHVIMEDGKKHDRHRFEVKHHDLKAKGTARSTDAHKATYGAVAGGRRETRKGRKASRKNRKGSRRH